MHLAQQAANKCTVQWWFKKLCKGEEMMEMRSIVAGHQKLTTTNREQPSKLILVLALAAHILKLERYRDEHGPCARMTHKFMKHFILKKKKANLITTEVAKELNIKHSMVIWHLKQIGQVKKLDKRVPQNRKRKKIVILRCRHLLFYETTNHCLIGLWCVMKSGFYRTTGHIHLTSRQPTTTSSSNSATFCRGNAFSTSRRQKMLSKSSSNLEAWILTLQE